MLLPCSPCCSSGCDAIFTASRLFVTVQSFDYIEWKNWRFNGGISNPLWQYPVGHEWTSAAGFIGSAYAGTYEMTKILDTASQKKWSYKFSAGQHLTGEETMFVSVTGGGSTLREAALFLNAKYRHIVDASRVFTPTAADFAKSDQAYGVTGDLGCYTGNLDDPWKVETRWWVSNYLNGVAGLCSPTNPNCYYGIAVGTCSCSTTTSGTDWTLPTTCRRVFTDLQMANDSGVPGGDEKCRPSIGAIASGKISALQFVWSVTVA